MARTAENYLAALQGLLPQGLAWPRDDEAVLTQLLAGWGDGLARVDGRAEDLTDEADPTTAFEMLPDWERVCGLPDGCSEYEDTLAQRRAAVAAKLAQRGGQSPAYYAALLAAHGYGAAAVTEFRPFRAGMSAAGDPAAGADWAFAWRVEAPANSTTSLFAAGASAAGERLATWGNDKLECLVRSAAPAHTVVQFAYHEPLSIGPDEVLGVGGDDYLAID